MKNSKVFFMFSRRESETNVEQQVNSNYQIHNVLRRIVSHLAAFLNSFVPNAPFLYPLKTSENLKVKIFQKILPGV